MADFGNFKIETPQEVIARTRKQISVGLQSRDINQRNQAAFSGALQAIFGNQEVKDAERVNEALTNATTGVRDRIQERRDSGEEISSLDSEIDTLRAQRDVLLQNGNAEAATQATAALTKLGIAREEQDRLRARETRAQNVTDAQLTSIDRSNERAAAEGLLMFHEQSDGTFEALNLDDPTQLARHQTLVQDGSFPRTQVQVNSLEAAKQVQAARAKNNTVGVGKKLIENTFKKIDGARELMVSSNAILNIFKDDPTAGTVGSKAAGKIDNVLFQLRDAGNLIAGKSQGTDGVNNLVANDRFLEGEFSKRNINNSRVRGLVTGVAYSLARARDPGGRLSDDDFRRALDMIGGEGQVNPTVLAATLQDQIATQVDPLKMSITAMGDVAGGSFDIGLSQLNTLQEEFTGLSTNLTQQVNEFQNINSASSETPTPEGTTPLRVTIRGLD